MTLLTTAGLTAAFAATCAGKGFLHLPDLGPGMVLYGNSVAADGAAVVGLSHDSQSIFSAWHWTPSGGYVLCGQWAPNGFSHALPVTSEDGKVVVGARFRLTDDSAYIAPEVWRWTESGGMQTIGIPPQAVMGDRSLMNDFGICDLLISADGQTVAGDVLDGDFVPRAFVWTAEDGFMDASPIAQIGGLSRNGKVAVGWTASNPAQNLIWTKQDGARSLLPAGLRAGGRSRVSADGLAALGTAGDDATGNGVLWRWTASAGLEVIGPMPGYESESHALNLGAMSPDGQTAAGDFDFLSGSWRWTAAEGFSILPVTGGSTMVRPITVSTEGSAIVGVGLTGGGEAGTCRWTPSGGLRLVSDDFSSASGTVGRAQNVSADGSVIVGWTIADGTWLVAYRPVIENLTPSRTTAGSGETNVTIYGVGFENGAHVFFGSVEVATTYIGPTELRMVVPSTALPSPTDFATVQVTVLGPGGDISQPAAFTVIGTGVGPTVGQVQSSVASAGETVSVQTPPIAPDSAGVTASLENSTGTAPATVTAATYTQNPTPAPAFEAGGGFVDLQVSGADPGDRLSSSFYYPQTVTGAAEAGLALKFYNGSQWINVLSSGGTVPIKSTQDNLDGTVSGGRFRVVFDNTSRPQITQLNGTVFAVAIPDTTPPTVSCPNVVVPCNANLLVPVNYAAATVRDNIDPAPRVTYSIPSGSGFKVGITTVTCTAMDAAGNSAVTTFTVTRAPLGFTGFLSPIGGSDATGGSFASPLRTFKSGSTVPVKFSAACGGTPVTTGIHHLQVIKYSNATTSGTPIDATPQDAASMGNQFQISSQEWHFNLDTKNTGVTTGIWQFVATLSDGSQHAVWVQMK